MVESQQKNVVLFESLISGVVDLKTAFFGGDESRYSPHVKKRMRRIEEDL